MPRQSHGRPISAAGPSKPKKRKPAKSRGLNALNIAEKENPDEFKIRQHRLGEIYEDDEERNTKQDVDERSAKRRKVEHEGGGDEGDSGSDPDGERWHVMGEEDEGEEDSEIESEDAFRESDEEKFAGYEFRGSKGRRKEGRGKGVEHKRGDGEEEGDEDDLGEEAVDLATAWDMDDADEVEEQARKSKKRPAREHGEEEDMDNGSATSEEDDNFESGPDDDVESDFSVSDAEDGDHSRLQNFVQSLSKKPEESRSNTSAPKSTKISAADLLQYVKDPAQRQSLRILQNSERKGPEVYKGGIPGRLAAPLPKRQQDRLDRSAAYDESKKELGKWVDTIKQNRRAEHLSFPLVDPNDPVAHQSRQLASTQGTPMNDLERKVQEIMVESGLMKGGVKGGDELDKEDQELEEQKIPFEEVQARRAELRKQRDLMFREEIRSRRVKKIKSKAYRRIHRKERAKRELEQRVDDAANGLVDSGEEREHNDRRRAEERMGSRHRESKWAKGMKEAGRAKWNEGARGAMEEAARRDEELRRRIEGRDVDDDSLGEEEGDSDDYSSGEEGAALDRKLAQLSSQGVNVPSTKLGSMAFMQRAEAAKKARNDAELQEIKRQLDDDEGLHLGSDLDTEELVGRQKYGAKVPEHRKQPPRRPLEQSEFEERLSDDDVSGIEGQADALPAVTNQKVPKKQSQPKTPSTTAFKSVSSKPQSNGTSKQKASTNGASSKEMLKPMRQHETALNDYTSSSGSEHEDQSAALEGGGPVSIADDIFAGDDAIVRDFQKEKQNTVVEEGDQIVDNGLPGWGSWAGAGISKKAQKRQKNKSVTTIKGITPEKRQDSKLDRVIINEKTVKKNGKYLATELPHPFESRQQYERSLRLPLGPEWTTKSTFQDATKPRVLVKQGVIKPMVRPHA